MKIFANGAARVDACEMDIMLDDANPNAKITATVERQTYTKQGVIRQRVTYTAKEPLALTRAAAANMQGVCFRETGILSGLSDGSIVIHYCISRWQGEGQWRSSTLSDLGLFRASNHSCANVIVFSSVGNQTTSMRYPLIFIVDRELGKTWFFEIESGIREITDSKNYIFITM